MKFDAPVSNWNFSAADEEFLRILGERGMGVWGFSGMKMATSNARMTKMEPNANGGPGMIVCAQKKNRIAGL